MHHLQGHNGRQGQTDFTENAMVYMSKTRVGLIYL